MALTPEEVAPQGIPPGLRMVTFTDADGNTQYMLEADNGTKAPRTGGRWWVCPKCGHEFPETKMVEVNGTFYCTLFKDYLEAQEELRND